MTTTTKPQTFPEVDLTFSVQLALAVERIRKANTEFEALAKKAEQTFPDMSIDLIDQLVDHANDTTGGQTFTALVEQIRADLNATT